MSGRLDAIFGGLGQDTKAPAWSVNRSGKTGRAAKRNRALDSEPGEGAEKAQRKPAPLPFCAGLRQEEEVEASDRMALAFEDDEHFTEVMDDPIGDGVASTVPSQERKESAVRTGVLSQPQQQSSGREETRKPCFSFAQSGECRFGAACRFKHELPECVLNPQKYQRYELDWDENEPSNVQAASQTFAMLRSRQQAELKADLTKGVTFRSTTTKTKAASGLTKITTSREEALNVCQLYDQEEGGAEESSVQMKPFKTKASTKRNFRRKKTNDD